VTLVELEAAAATLAQAVLSSSGFITATGTSAAAVTGRKLPAAQPEAHCLSSSNSDRGLPRTLLQCHVLPFTQVTQLVLKLVVCVTSR
jgi:hypothetical protein